MEKKANKMAFKLEKTRQEKELLNLKQNMQGLKLSWNSGTFIVEILISSVLRRELLTDKTCQACMKGVNGTWYSNIWLVILSEVIPWINVSSVMSVMATAANFCYPRNLLKYFKIYFSYKLSLSRRCHMCWMHSALQRILHIWSDCSIKLFDFVQSSVSTSLSLTLAIKYRASV